MQVKFAEEIISLIVKQTLLVFFVQQTKSSLTYNPHLYAIILILSKLVVQKNTQTLFLLLVVRYVLSQNSDANQKFCEILRRANFKIA